jgi:hypothetical protein
LTAVLVQKPLDVAVIHGCSALRDPHNWVPTGHCLSHARLRHLRESDLIVVTKDAVPVGLAAYKRAGSDVRVVHEFVLDRMLIGPDAVRVTDALLSALELLAYDDGISCLTFLLRGDIVMGPFERRGYTSLALEPSGAWLQKKLGWIGWCEIRSGHPS